MSIEDESIEFECPFLFPMFLVQRLDIDLERYGFDSPDLLLVNNESHGVIKIKIMFFVFQCLVEEGQCFGALGKRRCSKEIRPESLFDRRFSLPLEEKRKKGERQFGFLLEMFDDLLTQGFFLEEGILRSKTVSNTHRVASRSTSVENLADLRHLELVQQLSMEFLVLGELFRKIVNRA